jgi:hypothetical protein
MSSHDFGLLVGKKAPFLGFGEIIQNSRDLEQELHTAADQVRKQIRSIFGAKLDNPSIAPNKLDEMIQEVWETGSNPEADNVGLFTRGLGLILTEATFDLLGGELMRWSMRAAKAFADTGQPDPLCNWLPA